MPRPRRLWSPNEEDRLLAMRHDGHSWGIIGSRLGRNPESCRFHYYDKLTQTPRPSRLNRSLSNAIRETGGFRVSDEQFAAAMARRDAADRRTLTQQFCGDPPPGYSALDQKRDAGGR